MILSQASKSAATPEQHRGMRHAILTQCFGCLGLSAFTNGILLVYLTALDISAPHVMLYLSLFPLGDALLRVPSACLADRFGKKRVAYPGMALQVAGFAVFALSAPLSGGGAEIGAVVGICAFTAGIALSHSSWFALLSPIVPDSIRGHFFGSLRFWWQSCGILFAAWCAGFLAKDSPIGDFQIVLGLIALTLVVRVAFYWRIPEMEDAKDRKEGLRQTLTKTMRAKGFVIFCLYTFLLAIFTRSSPVIFGLIEKRALGMGDNQVVLLGNLAMVGAIFGFLAGGKAVDRFGTKPVFLVCHIGYALVLFLFLGRDLLPGGPVVVLGGLHFAFGVVYAAASIALSTTLLALIPPQNKSLSTSICMTLLQAGGGISGWLCAWALASTVFERAAGSIGGGLSSYNAILLIYGAIVVVLMLMLRLVPTVHAKPKFLPRAD